VRWMWAMVEDRLRDRLRASPEVANLADLLEQQVVAGQVAPAAAAEQVLAAFDE